MLICGSNFFVEKGLKRKNSLALAWGSLWVAPVFSEGGDGSNTWGHLCFGQWRRGNEEILKIGV